MSRNVKAIAIPFEVVLAMSEFNGHQLLTIFYASAEESQNSMSQSIGCTNLIFSGTAVVCFSPSQQSGMVRTHHLQHLEI